MIVRVEEVGAVAAAASIAGSHAIHVSIQVALADDASRTAPIVAYYQSLV